MSILDDIRQRAKAATKGPWGVGASSGTIYGYVEGSAPTLLFEPHPNHIIPATGRPSEDCLADGEFIAFARGDIPRLLGALDAVLALADCYKLIEDQDIFDAVNDALEGK